MKTIGTIVATLAAEFLISVIFIHAGTYGVAATSPDLKSLC
jgi:hypothetical protein